MNLLKICTGKCWIWGMCLWIAQVGYSQDPIFSQYYSAPLSLNPAFAGNTHAPKFAMNYRLQWPNMPAVYNTYAFSYDQYFSNLNSGFGVLILGDDQGEGILKTNKFAAIYSYRLQINKDYYAKFGIEAGWVSARYDWNRFIFPDQLSNESGPFSSGGSLLPTQELDPGDYNLNYLDVAFGGLVYSPNFYAGLTLKHINTPDQSILQGEGNLQDGLPMRLSLHVGAQYGVFEGLSSFYRSFVSPSIMYVQQGPFRQIIGGTYLGFGPLFLGVYYRHTSRNSDAAIVSAGIQKGIYKVGYSFDMTLSSLTIRTGGAHEIGVVINLENSPRFPGESKYNDCFQIFR